MYEVYFWQNGAVDSDPCAVFESLEDARQYAEAEAWDLDEDEDYMIRNAENGEWL